MGDVIKKIKIKKEDGTFTDYIPIGAEAKNIITEDGESVEDKLNKKPYYFDNITEMKAANYLVEGDCAITLGYYEPNDGGGGTYQIVKNDTLVDDGGSVHNLVNGNKAKLIVNNNRVNILQYGCYKNKESKYLENTLKIQTALSIFKIIDIPRGTFYCSTININESRSIEGVKSSSKLIYVGENNSCLLNIGNPDRMISDITINGLGITQKNGLTGINGIEFSGKNPGQVIISNCHIINLSGDGIKGGHIHHVNNVEIFQNFIENCYNNINLQYNAGQINAIWIHHNNIVRAKNNGILFFGNNVVIESNTIQANKKHAISVGDSNWEQNFNQYCSSSVISNNYTEKNGNDFEHSVIGIYSGYLSSRQYNRFILNLIIENNYFVEVQSGFTNHIIDCFVDIGTAPSAKACLLKIQNNYSNVKEFIHFNFLNALSYGSVIGNNSIQTDLTEYPFYVKKMNYDPFKFEDSHSDGYQNFKHNEMANFVNNNTQLTYFIYYNSLEISDSNLNNWLNKLYSKIIVNGEGAYGNAGAFNYLAEKIGSNAKGNDGTIKKEIQSGADNMVPFISPITLVKDCDEIEGNATYGLQITLIPNGYYNFTMMILFDLLSFYRGTGLLKIKKTTPAIKSGTTAPNGNIDYIGQVYLDKTSKKWYVAETLTTWREASTN